MDNIQYLLDNIQYFLDNNLPDNIQHSIDNIQYLPDSIHSLLQYTKYTLDNIQWTKFRITTLPNGNIPPLHNVLLVQ